MREILCPSCNKHFKQKKNLYAHIRNTHGINPELTGSLLCPVENCVVRTHKYGSLRQHLATSHSVKCEKEVAQFKSWEEFVKWKQETETKENNAYVLSTGSVTLATQERKTYYSCHRSQRSGTKSKQPHKMTRRSPGTKKILKTCPSTIEALINKRGVSVVRWKTHWGHFDDISNVESNLLKLFCPPADGAFGAITDNPNTECSLLTVDSAYHKNLKVTSQTDIPEKSCNDCILDKTKSHECGVISGSIAHTGENDTILMSDLLRNPYMNTTSTLEKEAVKNKLDLLHKHISTNQLTDSQGNQLNKMLDQCVKFCMQARTGCQLYLTQSPSL